MKKINELTEEQILKLTDDQVRSMVRYEMAEEGIQFVQKPKTPTYKEVPKPDKRVYTCGLFEDNISFDNIETLEDTIKLFKSFGKLNKIVYNYNLSEKYFRLEEIKRSEYQHQLFDIISKDVYSSELYKDVSNYLEENDELKSSYDKAKKEFRNYYNENKYIKENIDSKIDEVKQKYYTLDTHCWRFKNDYLPLAENNEEIAMKFMKKAYSIDKDQERYILKNYKTVK